jgi:hypothetical protein
MSKVLIISIALCALFCWSSAIPIQSHENKCCKVCSSKSIACGDVCIDKGATCHVKPGCACNHTSISTDEAEPSRDSNAAVGCIDEDGNAVDWWMVYKMPSGFQYAYRDSSSRSETVLSVTADKTLDCTTCGALGKTLHQIYANKDSLAYVLLPLALTPFIRIDLMRSTGTCCTTTSIPIRIRLPATALS